MSTENIVPFKIVASRPASDGSQPADGDSPDAEQFTPEQIENIECITELTKFLLDNRANVKNFICCVATTDPAREDPMFSEHHVFATPLYAGDFALGIKILENTFFKKLNNGGI